MRAGSEGAGERAALGLGWQLQGVTGRAEFLRAAGELLLHLIPADVVGWNAVELESGIEVVLFPNESLDVAALTAGLAEVAAEHPMLRSYLAEPGGPHPAPRRLSDLASREALLGNRAYVEFLRPMGAEHQLTVLTARPRPSAVRGWALNRETGDFSDRDVALARALQTMLGLLDRAVESPAPAESAAAERLGLTAREVEVLGHIGAGLTAEAAARLLRISMRTVRKHLENAYRKLDCHDRLVAVQRAQALGIIPEGRRRR